MSTSNAVSESAKSAVVGYKITKGNYALSSPNLPQRIAILSEANTDKQTGLSLAPFEATSAAQVAAAIGAGSPGYMAMRILRPLTGGGLSGIPTVVYPVATASGATATVASITVTGTATTSAKHTLIIAGRASLDGQPYTINVAKSDTPTAIVNKYISAINAVYGCPVIASAGTTGVLVLTSKWKGISSIFSVRVEMGGQTAGVTYSTTIVSGTTTGTVTDALAKFENDWNTIVINPYADDSTTLDLLESVNGRPDPTNPTGRFSATVFKPFVALFSKSTTDPVTDISVSTRLNDCTNVYCPAPNVGLLPVEVAANVARLVADTAQNNPNIDVNNMAYPDALVDATGIGNYSNYEYRDTAVKAGLSTVDYKGGDITIKDLVTTYHPTDEVTPQFAYVRNLMLDWNIRYAYMLLEQIHVVNHTLVPDGTIVAADNVISPSQWKGILHSMFADLANRGLIADAAFSTESLTVRISSTNPDRFETFFRYKRTGVARICSTTAEAGFYYGN